MNDPVTQICGCNQPSCTDPIVQNIPGPQGNPGINGTNGTNGVNAFTTTTTPFIQPAVSGTVNVSVLSSVWMATGEPIFIAIGGSYLVTAIVDALTITVQNLGYVGNAVPTTVIASASQVTPSGIKGADGTSGAGSLLAVNNLSDVANVGTSRNNLGLGTLATANSVNNGNWSGTPLAINNGGTGAITAAAARTALSAQTADAILTALAALVTANNDMLYFTGIDAPALLNNTTAFGRSALLDTTAVAFRSRMGGLLPRYGVIGSVTAINANSAATDNAVTLESSRFRIDKITFENASISLTTATVGVFTAAGGGGTTVAADQALSALTATTKFKDLTLGGSVTADVVTANPLYVRIGSAQGSAATVNCWIIGWKYD